MAIKLGIRASGQLSSTQQTLYQTTPTQTASVKVVLVNTSSNTVKVNIWAKDGTSTARLISAKDQQILPKAKTIICYGELGESDSIEGKATAKNVVDYTITGLLKT